MRSRFKVGLAGVGPHMMEHLIPALRLMPGVEIVAAVSSSEVKQRELGHRLWIPEWYGEIESLLRANICDGIVVSGSVDYHERVLAECIKRSMPVFVEKPPAMNLDHLLVLAGMAKGTDNVAIGLNLPRTEIVSQIDGFLYTAKASIRNLKINYHTNKPRLPLWNLDSLLRSFLLAIVIHPLSLARHYLGNGIRLLDAHVHAFGDRLHLRIDLEGNGCLAEITTSNDMPHHVCDFDFELAHGERLKAYGLSSLVKAGGRWGNPIWTPSPLGLSTNSNGYLHEISEFVGNSLARKYCNGLADAVPLYRIIEEIITSGRGLEGGFSHVN